MKQHLRILLFFCFSLSLGSCEKGIFDPQPKPECLETRQEDDRGWTVERSYDGKKLTQIRYLYEGELRDYYEFTYGSDGRINKSQYVLVGSSTSYLPEMITYNEKGQWTKSTFTSSNGDETVQTVEYDAQGQIQKITSATTRSGTTTVNYTATYTWENGNNIRRTYTSPTQEQVTLYEFDLDRENMRQKAQQKLSFWSLAVAYNKNMLRRISSTTTTGTTTTQSETINEYQYDEDGYPSVLTRYTTAGSNPSSMETTYFYYECD